MVLPPESITGLSVALGVGLLVGLERERAKGDGPERAAGGIRTFTLIGLLGGLAPLIGPWGVPVAGGFVALAVVASYWRTRIPDPGLTTEVAMLVTFALGVLAMSRPALAAGMGVLLAAVLAAKASMHRFTRILSAQEMHDLLLLLASAFIVLPMLPDRTIDPWGALDPHRLWLLVVAVMGVSATAYVALRAFGSRIGLALAGLAGGFVSATATVAAMGDGARANPRATAAFASGGLLANVATIVQMVVVLGTLSPELLRRAAWPLLAAGIVAAAAAAIAGWQSLAAPTEGTAASAKRPFEPARVFGFVAILTAILLIAAIARQALGNASLPWVLAASGFADVHAAAASAAQLVASGKIDAAPALVAVFAAMTANSTGKCVMAIARGGRAYAWRVVPGISLMMVAFAAAMPLAPPGHAHAADAVVSPARNPTP